MSSATTQMRRIRASLVIDDEEISGFLLNEEIDTLEVQFPAGFHMSEPISTKMTLRVSNGSFTKELETRLAGRRVTPDGEVCKFRSCGEGFFDLVHMILRRAPRVRVKEKTTVELRRQDTGKRVEAIMIDISACGLGLFVLEEVEATLADIREVECSFALPDMYERFSLPSKIEVRLLDGAQVRYGIAFDQDAPNYDEQAEAIRDFVMAMQLRELQHRSR